MSEEKPITAKELEIERGYAQAFKEELNELKTKYKGIDVDAVKAMQTELQALKTKTVGGENAAQVQKLIDEALEAERKRLEPTINEYKTTSEKLAGELKKERVTKVMLQKAAEIFNADGLELLTQVIERDCDTNDAGNIFIKGTDGKPQFSKKDATKYMEHSEYLDQLATQFPSLAKSTTVAAGKGSESKINATSGSTIGLAEISAMPDKGKAYLNKLALENPQAYKALFSA